MSGSSGKSAMSGTINVGSAFELGNGVQIRNRTFKSAMSEQLGDGQHNPTQGLFRLYHTWAKGGIGISMTGNVMVDRSALGEPKNVVLDDASDLAAFRNWASAGKQDGAHIWMQLNHPGKQIPSFLSKEPVAPSAIPLGKGLEKAFNKPRALTDAEIKVIIGKFVTAAKLAKDTGFTGVQIHGAHGYLVSQFLSPRHNHRQDQWGGSLENRARFLLEIYRGIRQAVGKEFPVSVKLNTADFMKDGFSFDEAVQVVAWLEEAGIDLVEISGGTYENPSMMGSASGMDKPIKASTAKREAYFLDYAMKLREAVSVPLVVTGGFRSAQAMNEALQVGATDFIGLARSLALEPDFPASVIADDHYAIRIDRPTTGVKAVDRFSMLDITWYEFQLERMAQGKRPKAKLNAWYAVAGTVGRLGMHAFAQRRA